MGDPDDNLLEAEAAAFLRLKPQTLANWRFQRRGPTYSKLGGRVVYTREALVAFVRAHGRTATAAPPPEAA